MNCESEVRGISAFCLDMLTIKIQTAVSLLQLGLAFVSAIKPNSRKDTTGRMITHPTLLQ